MSRRRDVVTPDMFPHASALAPVVQRFDPERIRAARPSGRIARAVAEAIKESPKTREQIAADMSAYLDEAVTAAMLDQYTSTANEKNNMPAHRLVALMIATSDIRVANAMLAETSFIALDGKYEPLIRREMAKEARDRLEREINAADAQWRANK